MVHNNGKVLIQWDSEFSVYKTQSWLAEVCVWLVDHVFELNVWKFRIYIVAIAKSCHVCTTRGSHVILHIYCIAAIAESRHAMVLYGCGGLE